MDSALVGGLLSAASGAAVAVYGITRTSSVQKAANAIDASRLQMDLLEHQRDFETARANREAERADRLQRENDALRAQMQEGGGHA